MERSSFSCNALPLLFQTLQETPCSPDAFLTEAHKGTATRETTCHVQGHNVELTDKTQCQAAKLQVSIMC